MEGFSVLFFTKTKLIKTSLPTRYDCNNGLCKRGITPALYLLLTAPLAVIEQILRVKNHHTPDGHGVACPRHVFHTDINLLYKQQK
jgi:hypothetical protein